MADPPASASRASHEMNFEKILNVRRTSHSSSHSIHGEEKIKEVAKTEATDAGASLTLNANPAGLDAENGETVDNNEPSPEQLYSVFSPKTKLFLVLMTVFSTFFSPFSAFVYLPAITPIAESYHRSLGELNLTVTVYQIMQAIAPLFFGDLSDRVGRRIVYMLTFTIYLGANIGLALQNNYAALMVLRAMQSTGCSATVAIGNAVIADAFTSADRGAYITAVVATAQLSPAIAPVIGGILTQYLGWRSTFWFLVISAAVFLLIYIPFAPEVSCPLRYHLMSLKSESPH